MNPSPYPMQQLISNLGNPSSWSSLLFAKIRDEGLDLSKSANDITL